MTKKKIALLAGTFPAMSETFVLREYEALRRSERIDIAAFAVKRPRGAWLNREYEQLTGSVFYLRPGHAAGMAFANCLALLGHPFRYLGAVSLFGKALNRAPVPTCLGHLCHFAAGVFLGWHLKKRGFAAIHAHFETAGNIALFAHLVWGLEFTLTLHASDDLYYGAKPLLEQKVKNARLVISNSEYNLHFINLLTFYKYTDKIHVVYNCLDPALFAGFSAKRQCSRPIRLLSVGNFTGFKGYHTVLAALALLKKNGVPFVYRIAGHGNTREQEMIEALATRHDLLGTVELLGAQPFSEILKLLDWCDVLIMNSEISEAGLRDGMPNVIGEAMMARRPVVSTYISDIPNVVENGETGFLVPEKNPKALAKTLMNVASNFERTVPIVQKAYEFAVRRFDAKANGSRLEALLAG